MAHVLNGKKVLCKVDSTGVLPELGCITGPIRRCRVTEQQLYALVKDGRIVYELNPKDETQMVRMTKLNMNIRQFEQKESAVTKVETVEETPVVEEQPVVTEEVVEETSEVNEDAAVEEKIETPVVETKADGNVVVNPVVNNQGKNKNKNKHGNYNPNQKIQTADI